MSEKLKQTSTNRATPENLKISIIGGGLVGSLAAIHLGQKGFDVNLYEFREGKYYSMKQRTVVE